MFGVTPSLASGDTIGSVIRVDTLCGTIVNEGTSPPENHELPAAGSRNHTVRLARRDTRALGSRMSITVLYNDNDTIVDVARTEYSDLWLRLDDLERASGWRLKPEGACLGDVCVQLPDARRDRYVRDEGTPDTRFNLPELARLLDMPSLHDEVTQTWCFVDNAAARTQRMASLEAPRFTLPDLAGKMHSLTDYRGQKIFMVAWASW
jgi:hypothetical protein